MVFCTISGFSHDLTKRQGLRCWFIWFGLGFVGGIPFVLGMDIAWIDAFFAGISGITTTGAEVFPDLSILPMSLRFYRMWRSLLVDWVL